MNLPTAVLIVVIASAFVAAAAAGQHEDVITDSAYLGKTSRIAYKLFNYLLC